MIVQAFLIGRPIIPFSESLTNISVVSCVQLVNRNVDKLISRIIVNDNFVSFSQVIEFLVLDHIPISVINCSVFSYSFIFCQSSIVNYTSLALKECNAIIIVLA
jgi:hypothetical protein